MDYIKEQTIALINVEKLRSSFNPADYHDTQVKAYSTSNLFSFGFLNPTGTVLSWRLLLRTLAMCGIATFVLFFTCPTTPAKLGWQFCFPALSSSDGLIFASLVSFLLGLFQTTTFSRWWSTREKLSGIMNNVSYVSIVVQSFVAGDANIMFLKNKTIRWLNLTHALVYKQANREQDISDLGDLVTKEEADALHASPNMTATSISWVIAAWRELAVKNAINPAAVVVHAMTYMATILTSAQDVFTFLDTQMPYSYLHLLTLITKIHLAFVVFYGGGIIGGGVAAESWGRIIFGYAIIITNNFIYEGLLAIHDMLVNPLGSDVGDFPTKLYKHNTETFSRYVQGGPTIDIITPL